MRASSPLKHSLLLRYGGALLAVSAGFLLRVALTSFVGLDLPTYITFYPAVMVTALLAGFGPGLVATAAAALATDYWLLPPVGFGIESLSDAVGLALFSSMGLFMSAVAEHSRRTGQKAAAYEKELALRESQEEIRRQREWLQVTLNSIGDAVLATDSAGRITFLNPVAARLTGYGSPEAEGKAASEIFRIINEQTRVPAEDIVGRVLREGQVVALANHTALVARDGTEVPIEDSAAPIKDSAGNICGVVLVFHDVAQKRRAQEALARLAEVVESSEDAILSKDLNGIVKSWNGGATRLFGYQPEEIIGQPITLLLPPDRLDEENHIMDRLRAGERLDHYETVRVGKDGLRFDVSASVSPLRNVAGEITGASKIIRDITQQKRAEQALRDSEERLELFIEHAPASLAMFDLEMRYLSVSRRWLADFDLGERDLRGLSHYEVFPDIPEHWKGIHRRCLAGEVIKSEGERYDRADGSAQWLRWEVRPWHAGPGKIGGVIIFSEDISASKHAEAELRRRADELNAAMDALSRLNAELEQRVEARTAEVRKANETLEQRVSERTAQLQIANNSLQASRTAALNLMEEAVKARAQVEQTSEELRRLNRILKAHSDTNQAIIRAQDEQQYLVDVCEIVVKDCGHAMVWIGLAEDDDARTVRPAAHAGFEEGYLKTLNISWADTERGRGPTGTAIRTGEPCHCRNMQTDPIFGPWREQAIKHGYAASLALPLMADGKAFGAITIYSKLADPFSEGEVRLLSELARSLANGINLIRTRQARLLAEQGRLEDEQRLRFALETTHIGAWSLDLVNHTAFRSAEHDRIFGYAEALPEWNYEMFLEHVVPEDRAMVDAKFHQAIATQGIWDFECRIRRPDGEVRWIWAAGRHGADASIHARQMAGIVQDITERKQFEATIARLASFPQLNPNPIIEIGLDGRLHYINPSATRLFPDLAERGKEHPWLAGFESLANASRLGDAPSLAREVAIGEHWHQQVLHRVGEPGRVRIYGFDITDRKRAEQRAYLLAETAGELLSAETPQKVVDQLCLRVLKFLNCELFFNFLVDEEQHRLRLNACAGISEDEMGKIQWLDFGVAVCGCVARDACRIVTEDVQHTSDPRIELVRSYGVQAYACHPLLVQGRVVGTLSFGARNRTRFSDEDLSLMKAVADQVAIAMERQQTQAALKKANTDLEHRVAARTAALHAAERYARSLLEASLDPLVTISHEGKITDVNLATELVTGVRRDALIGSSFSSYFTEPQQAEAGYQQVLMQGAVSDYPLTIRHTSGYKTDVLYNAAVYRNEAGEVQGVFAAARDITERKQAERRREFTSALLSLFAQKSSASAYLNSVVDTIRQWTGCHALGIRLLNEHEEIPYESSTGFEPGFLELEQRLSLKCDQCFCIRAVSGAFEDADRSLLTPGGSFRSDDTRAFVKALPAETLTRYRNNCMKFGFASVAIVPIRYREEVIGVIHLADRRPGQFPPLSIEFIEAMTPLIGEAVHRFQTEAELAKHRDHLEDLVKQRTSELSAANERLHSEIAQRQRAQEALQRTTEDLQRSNRDLEQFAYVASHDLQEPLRAVGGYVKLIQRRFPENVDPKAREFIAGAAEGATRMERLITDLLAFSRVGTRGGDFISSDFGVLLNDALENLQFTIKSADAQITRDELPTLVADPTQIMQVFQNLIGNAIKFRGEHPPQIHVGARQEAQRWVFSVRDNGIGIEPQYFDRIFQIFQRLHTRKVYAGTGIGLAICKKIVERHGGAIWLESQPEQGTTFFFSIPSLKDAGA